MGRQLWHSALLKSHLVEAISPRPGRGPQHVAPDECCRQPFDDQFPASVRPMNHWHHLQQEQGHCCPWPPSTTNGGKEVCRRGRAPTLERASGGLVSSGRVTVSIDTVAVKEVATRQRFHTLHSMETIFQGHIM